MVHLVGVLVSVALPVLLLVLGFTLVSSVAWKSKLRLPPGPPRWPIFGNLLLLGPLPHKDMAQLSSAHGPLVYLRLGAVDAVTTDDPEVIREILVRQDDVFASRPRTLAAVHLAYGCRDVALAPFGPHWKRMRRTCMEHLLTTKQIESFSGHRKIEACHLARDVWRNAGDGEPVNLRQVLATFSMNNVTRMLLGKQYFGPELAGPAEAAEFMHITHELFWLLGLIYLGDYLPLWRWLDPLGCEKKMRDVEKRMDRFHQKIIEEHREAMARRKEAGDGENKEAMDFVDVLLSLPGEDGKERMDDKEIKALMQVCRHHHSCSREDDFLQHDVDQFGVGHDCRGDGYIGGDERMGHDGGDQAPRGAAKSPGGARQGGRGGSPGAGIRPCPPDVPPVRREGDLPAAPGGAVPHPPRVDQGHQAHGLRHTRQDARVHQHVRAGAEQARLGRRRRVPARAAPAAGGQRRAGGDQPRGRLQDPAVQRGEAEVPGSAAGSDHGADGARHALPLLRLVAAGGGPV
ncbi:hypothetical protein GW17_00020657 [Ensete ventricosum]|nr:hypothetical protein GW17_00020657 [Ensete ventricosum]RZR87090.1 hypothetical protein BHM03_00014406 [Ensete ventricosum]